MYESMILYPDNWVLYLEGVLLLVIWISGFCAGDSKNAEKSVVIFVLALLLYFGVAAGQIIFWIVQEEVLSEIARNIGSCLLAVFLAVTYGAGLKWQDEKEKAEKKQGQLS